MTLLGGGGTALDEAGKRPTAAKFRPGMRCDCSWGRKARRKRLAPPAGAWLSPEGKEGGEQVLCWQKPACPSGYNTHLERELVSEGTSRLD